MSHYLVYVYFLSFQDKESNLKHIYMFALHFIYDLHIKLYCLFKIVWNTLIV